MAAVVVSLSPSAISARKSSFLGTHRNPFTSVNQKTQCSVHGFQIDCRARTRKENPIVINRRMQKKFNGSPLRPRLSVFCSEKQLYAMLVDDQNKKILFYGSTLQKSIRAGACCSTIEAAQRVGEELVRACEEQKILEISSYDRNGFARGQRMEAFEIAISRFGFLQRRV